MTDKLFGYPSDYEKKSRKQGKSVDDVLKEKINENDQTANDSSGQASDHNPNVDAEPVDIDLLFLGVCNIKSAPSEAAFALAAKVAICRVLRLQISPARKVAVWRVLRLQSARIAPLDFSKTCFIWSKRFFARNRKRPRNFVIAGLCYFIQ